LKEKQVQFGINTPVEILTEIEDIEARMKIGHLGWRADG